MNHGMIGVNQAEKFLFQLAIEYFPFELGVICLIVRSAQKANGNLKAAGHIPTAAVITPITVFAEGFFEKFIRV